VLASFFRVPQKVWSRRTLAILPSPPVGLIAVVVVESRDLYLQSRRCTVRPQSDKKIKRLTPRHIQQASKQRSLGDKLRRWVWTDAISAGAEVLCDAKKGELGGVIQ
jgi:hypothetical protein